MAPSLKDLQELIDICQTFGEDYDVIFNVNKTKCMLFKSKSYIIVDPIITLYDEKTEFVEQFKYLGIVLAKDDEIEIQSQYRKLCATSINLISKFKDHNDNLKVDLFKNYHTSILVLLYDLTLELKF